MYRINISRRSGSWLLVSALIGCGSDPSTDDDSTSGDTNIGGYTGLGPLTGVSGHYGSGEPSTGGTSSVNATVPTATGGSLPTGAGGSTMNVTPTGGAVGFTWPGAYDPNGNPPVPSGEHNAGANCMSSACHASSQASRAFAFGGTVYAKGTTTALAHTQIAIVSDGKTYSTYSGTNGNFWLPLASAPNLNWTTAKIYLRNATGEIAKPTSATVNAGCNSCHGSSQRIVGP